MATTINLKKGYDIKIIGSPEKKIQTGFKARTHAVKPTDFHGISPIPKLLVQVGDDVKAGDPIFFDKKRPDIMHAAPVSGEVVEIKRGEKRSIAEVVILADDQVKFKDLERINVNSTSRETIVKHLLATGCWPFIKQRPFNVIADENETPKAIFVSGFSSAPLAPDYDFALQGYEQAFKAGMEVLSKLSNKVYLGVPGATAASKAYDGLSGVTINKFNGPHPAGNVGVQIHHTNPIAKGEIVWTLNPYDVITIGNTFAQGKFNTERLIAMGGPVVNKPQYYRTYLGASVKSIAAGNLKEEHVRYISGDVLSGDTVDLDGHLGAFATQLSVLEEGDKYEFFGWLKPSYPRPSLSRTFGAFLRPNKQYNVNTNTHGEPRAFVVTGAYEQVTPMDLYPMQLLKSVLFRDFELMEGLGIYEVVEEDLALCGFVCPSKTQVQEILREGLDYMREQV